MTVVTAITSPGFSIWQIKNIPQEIRFELRLVPDRAVHGDDQRR